MDEIWGGFSEWLTGTSDMRQWDWGSTADWVTGLLTFAAVVVAVQTFRHDRRRQLEAQASLIGVEYNFVTNEPWADRIIRVRNNSQLPVTSVSVMFNAESADVVEARRVQAAHMAVLKAQLRDAVRIGAVSRFGMWQLLRQFRHLKPTHGFVELKDLAPGETDEVILPHPYGAFMMGAQFKDSLGRQWAKDVSTHRVLRRSRARKMALGANGQLAPQGEPDATAT
ncbi:hypothetical protein HQQ82_02600 [Rathayibacter sp. VKM Ac-2856]|uniref:hypothetical protein n=1 Tax=unclassified Rathayibacter TaxID=2609250 RepID=UPI00156638AB|nr:MULTISPECIES: hypothetical protein [unclassified Rathayibacter]NQX03683.1 hypothetical protein [Rathayibacter sp. VKM Ac-2858]NQX18851.1 hypothetical protein [Rathayibacter sp. VKM Ac-2856]